MTTVALSTAFPTLLDVVKRTDPNGAIANVVEALTPKNAILQDAVWVEGNLPTGHRFTTRTGLPAVTWRRFNEGISGGKSITSQIDESAGMLDGLSRVDVALAKLNGNEAAFRASEDRSFMVSLNKEMETGFFYHSTKTAPEKIMGLSPRMDATTSPGGSQIVKCDSSPSGSDQTSIWLVGWSPDTVFAFYPKGSMGGIQMKDKGELMLDDGSGANKMINVYATYWTWQAGLAVKDWRYLSRICNIDTSALDGTADTLIPAMIKAYNQLKDTSSVKPVFYCNRTVATYLHLQTRKTGINNPVMVDSVAGKPVMTVLGIPVRVTDAITNTEAIVS